MGVPESLLLLDRKAYSQPSWGRRLIPSAGFVLCLETSPIEYLIRFPAALSLNLYPEPIQLAKKACSSSSSSTPIMAAPGILQTEQDLLMYTSLFDNPKDGDVKSRGVEIEKKIEFLENLAGKVSNRRSRRWLNDRLLMELVPHLNAEEIRGLFAPPPWGDEVPPSAFSMTNAGEWDNFRSIDMDKEASIIKSLGSSSSKQRAHLDHDKVTALAAWHRIDGRTREALRRCCLSDLINGYEECVRSFVKDSKDGDVLVLHVQDPFYRLLLHGVCEFYNLVSTTATVLKNGESLKATRIKKKQSVSYSVLPNITLCNFLKMAKEGLW